MRPGWVPVWGLATAMLAGVTYFSAATVTHGFASYYAAARLLMEGRLGPSAYDDAWFGGYLQQLTGTNIRDIFTPNPPTMAMMALPIAALDHGAARQVWLFGSVALFAGAVFALARHRAKDGSVPVVALLLAMLSPAVFTNIRIGQGYLIVFALVTAAVLWLTHRRETAGGAALGLMLGLKLSGTALLLVLAAGRRWRALAAAGVMAIGVATAVTPFIDSAMWRQYPDVVRAFVQRPASSVTAYQTTLSLVRRLCVADPVWNPSPAAACEPVAFAIPYALVGLAALVTVALVYRSRDRRTDPGLHPNAQSPRVGDPGLHPNAQSPRVGDPGLAAGVVLSLLALPAAAEAHFILLGIPLLILRLRPIEMAVVALLLVVPLEFTAERFTSGWSVLLGYPRLYGAWLLWAAGIKDLLRGER